MTMLIILSIISNSKKKTQELTREVESLRKVSEKLNTADNLQFIYAINRMNGILKSGLQ